MTGNSIHEVVIVDGYRSPFVRAGDKFRGLRAQDLGAVVMRELLERMEISDGRSSKSRVKIDEVIFGNVGGPVDASNVARVITMNAGLHTSIPAVTVNRNCASGMESIAQAYYRLATGICETSIVGGVESMSNLPLLFGEKMTNLFAALFKAKTLQQRLAALFSFRPSFLKPIIAVQEALRDPLCGLNMGQTADLIARENNVGREEQDKFAIHSHNKAIKATKENRFKDEIIPVALAPKYKEVLADDIGPRENLSLEKLGKFKPYFDRRNGTVTIANACGITDGAVSLLMMTKVRAQQLGYPILGKIRSTAVSALEPERMGLGPVYASGPALKRANLSMQDMDIIEINEAFSAQVLCVQKLSASKKFAQEKLGLSEAVGEIPDEKLNVNGGAVALGHPVGASGARIVLTALKELKRRGGQFALASLCVGGGQGQTVILENVQD